MPNIFAVLLFCKFENLIYRNISYETKSFLSKLVLGYGDTEKFLIPTGATMVIQNAKEDLTTYSASLEFSCFFREKDKLELGVNYMYLDLPSSDHITQHYSYLLRMTNTFSKFDVFNELVVDTGFDYLKNGFDYSAGVRYAVNPDFHVKLKGENIFDAGLTRKYYYSISPTQKKLEAPVVDQKIMLSMEYLF